MKATAFRFWLFLFLAMTLLGYMAGCATAPKSFSDQVAYGYALQGAVRATLADAIELKRIAPKRGAEINAELDKTRLLLDTARGAKVPTDGISALNDALRILRGLEAELKPTKGGGP